MRIFNKINLQMFADADKDTGNNGTDMQVKNNQTKIDDLLKSIKEIGEGKLAKDEFATKMNELKEAIEKRDKELDSQFGNMETKLEQKLAETVDKIGGAFEKVQYVKPEGKEEEEVKYGKTMGEFLSKVYTRSADIKALAEATGADGGYLVPEQHLNEILKVELEASIVRGSGARIIPMTTSIVKVPAITYKSNARGSVFGGITAYWVDEGEELTESKPKFERVTLEPKKLIGYTEATEELTSDAVVSIGGLLSQLFGETLAFEEDYELLFGNGVGKPLGVVNAPATVTVSRTTASSIVTTDVVNMLAKFKGNLSRAVWVVNQTALPFLYKLKDENNNYIWHPGMSGTIAGSAPGTLYGIPIKISEKMNAVGTSGDILLADFGYYLIGDRAGLRIDYSDHYKFKNDMKVWRMIKRVDGQPWMKEPITPRNGTALSPFVKIN
jgi:HK97 family phage major capsid protein